MPVTGICKTTASFHFYPKSEFVIVVMFMIMMIVMMVIW